MASMGHPPNLPLRSSPSIASQVLASCLWHNNARRYELTYKESGHPLAHPTRHLGSWKESAHSTKLLGSYMDDVVRDALMLVQEGKLTCTIFPPVG
jgi:hypothetical protein